MKIKTLTVAAGVLAAVSVAGAAQAQNYAEVMVGLTAYPDLEWNGLDYSVDQSTNWGLAVGRHFTPTLTGEIEYTRTASDYTGFNNRITSDAFMVNGYYRFRPGAAFRPYVGAGVGVVSVGYDNVAPYERDDKVFGWQVIGGGEVPVNSRVSMFGEYRFQSAPGAEDGPTAWDYESHMFSVGARWNF